MRTPLPACIYNAIRKKFPSDTGTYKGFEDEDEEKEEEEEEENDEEEKKNDEEEENEL